MPRVIIMRPNDDKHMTGLHELMLGMLPGSHCQGPRGMGIGDLPEQMMDSLFGGMMPPGMMPDLTDSDSPTRMKVSVTPNGVSIQKMRTVHKRILGGENIRGAEPFEALLKYLYAQAQAPEMGDERIAHRMIEDASADMKEEVGSEVLRKVDDFITDARDGKLKLNTPEGKTITVTISETPGDSKDLKRVIAAVSDKIASFSGDLLELSPLEKTAARCAFNDGMLTRKDMRRASLVQTDLVKLLHALSQLAPTIDNGDNALGGLYDTVGSMIEKNNKVTVSDPERQELMKGLIAAVIGDTDAAAKFVYNSNITQGEEEIIHIDGYPVDLSKLRSMTKEEATKKYTPSLANYIYDEELKKITPDKIKSFLAIIKKLEANPEKADLVDMLKERLVEPLFSEIAPDEDALDNETLTDE